MSITQEVRPADYCEYNNWRDDDSEENTKRGVWHHGTEWRFVFGDRAFIFASPIGTRDNPLANIRYTEIMQAIKAIKDLPKPVLAAKKKKTSRDDLKKASFSEEK